MTAMEKSKSLTAAQGKLPTFRDRIKILGQTTAALATILVSKSNLFVGRSSEDLPKMRNESFESLLSQSQSSLIVDEDEEYPDSVESESGESDEGNVQVRLHPIHGKDKPLAYFSKNSKTIQEMAAELQQKGLHGEGAPAVIDRGKLQVRSARSKAPMEIDVLFATALPVPLTETGKAISMIVIVQSIEHRKGCSCWAITCPSCVTTATMASLGASGCVLDELDARFEREEKRQLGAGSFGSVSCAVEKGTGRAVAVKRLSNTSNQLVVCNEVKMLVLAQGHSNVAGFRGIFSGKDCEGATRWSLVFDYFPLGDLYDYISRLGRMKEPAALGKMKDVLCALKHIHSRGIFHRDVKPENVLLANDGRAVLTDFGIAVHVSDAAAMKQRKGSVGYASPEMILGKCKDTKGDVFAVGVMLYFTITLAIPFNGSCPQSIARKTLECVLVVDSKLKERMTEDGLSLLAALLQRKADNRPTAEDALQHPALGAGLSNGRGSKPKGHSSTGSMDEIGPVPGARSPSQSSDSASWASAGCSVSDALDSREGSMVEEGILQPTPPEGRPSAGSFRRGQRAAPLKLRLREVAAE